MEAVRYGVGYSRVTDLAQDGAKSALRLIHRV